MLLTVGNGPIGMRQLHDLHHHLRVAGGRTTAAARRRVIPGALLRRLVVGYGLLETDLAITIGIRGFEIADDAGNQAGSLAVATTDLLQLACSVRPW